MSRAVFLDLHGTLVLPLTVESLDELRVIHGAEEAVAQLCSAGFLCPVVTVQSRIAKGVFSEAEFREWFHRFASRMSAAGARLIGPYICPHRFRDPCVCKKPKTFLYEQAAREHAIELAASFVVGDTIADVEAAHRFGGRGCLLRGSGTPSQAPELAKVHTSHVTDSLSDAVEWILSCWRPE